MSDVILEDEIIEFQCALSNCIEDIKNLPNKGLRNEFYRLLKDLIVEKREISEKTEFMEFLDQVLFHLSEYYTRQKVAKNK